MNGDFMSKISEKAKNSPISEESPYSSAGLQASLEAKLASDLKQFGLPTQSPEGFKASIVLDGEHEDVEQMAKKFGTRPKVMK